MDEPTSFGVWLRQRRKALDLTQEELARRVGCATVTLQKIELDERRPSRDIAERLAAELHLTPSERPLFIRSARGELAVDQLQPATPPAPLHPLPTGTVTFLFTDIAGSTQRWEAKPEAMRTALARHDALLRAAITSHGGAVFKTVGDAFYAVFSTAPDALRAAIAAQRALVGESWAAVEPLRVRMALQSGTAELRDGDYFGAVLNRTARLLATGHGGQVLLAAATQELVRDQLPPETALRDLGAHHLPDVSRPEHLFQLVAPDLPADFPSLRIHRQRSHNLPPEQTAFIGRQRETEAVLALLHRADVRLVTLLGPGGTGKTRLAQHVAGEALGDYPDGVWFVDLAPLDDPKLVVSSIAEALQVRESGSTPLLDTLKAALADKTLLLLLDNFEQVTDAASTVNALLKVAPGVKALITSRIPLRIYGEKEYQVPPLELPDPKRLPPLDQLTQYEAVRLFIERAQDVRSEFAVTNDNAPAVAEICARLDGLPLAIELAAARVRLFAPQALLARLEQRLKLLTGGAKSLPGRQQTLRGAIEWSHDLLDEGEQQLFRRLAVFAGGRTFESVEAVCNAAGDLRLDVLDGIESLVSKSLLRQEQGAEGEPCFVMLETIHEYARERLAGSGEAQAVQGWHGAYFLALAEQAEPELTGPHQVEWLDRLEAEHDNLRAALRGALERNEVEMALRLGGALSLFWSSHGHLSEGRRWLATVLGRAALAVGVLDGAAERARSAALAKGLKGAGWLAFDQGDYGAARAFLQESLAISRELGDKHGSAQSLVALGGVVGNQGDYGAARELYQESLAISRELGDKHGSVFSLVGLGGVAGSQGDYGAARAFLQESLTISRELGDKSGIALSLMIVGGVAGSQGDYGAARAFLQESLAIWRELGDKQGIAYSLDRLGVMALYEHDDARARALFHESLAVLHSLGDTVGMAWCLEGLAGVAGAQHHPTRAARLWGMADALRTDTGVAMPEVDRARFERMQAAARAQLDEAAWTTAWAEGQAMTLDQAIAYALASDDQA